MSILCAYCVIVMMFAAEAILSVEFDVNIQVSVTPVLANDIIPSGHVINGQVNPLRAVSCKLQPVTPFDRYNLLSSQLNHCFS